MQICLNWRYIFSSAFFKIWRCLSEIRKKIVYGRGQSLSDKIWLPPYLESAKRTFRCWAGQYSVQDKMDDYETNKKSYTSFDWKFMINRISRLPVLNASLNPIRTRLNEMGFGATNIPVPNDVRCDVKHWMWVLLVSCPPYKMIIIWKSKS